MLADDCVCWSTDHCGNEVQPNLMNPSWKAGAGLDAACVLSAFAKFPSFMAGDTGLRRRFSVFGSTNHFGVEVLYEWTVFF